MPNYMGNPTGDVGMYKPPRNKAPRLSNDIDESQFDRGSLIYILGRSSSSLWAKKIMNDIEKGNRRLKNIQKARTGLTAA